MYGCLQVAQMRGPETSLLWRSSAAQTHHLLRSEEVPSSGAEQMFAERLSDVSNRASGQHGPDQPVDQNSPGKKQSCASLTTGLGLACHEATATADLALQFSLRSYTTVNHLVLLASSTALICSRNLMCLTRHICDCSSACRFARLWRKQKSGAH